MYRTWTIKFWPDHNFAWYLSVMKVNIALESGHFQNDGDIMPDLYFWRQLVIQCIENTIVTEPCDIGRPICAYRRPQMMEFHLAKVPNYHGKWLPSEKIKLS